MLSLNAIGTPWNGPRTRPAARSASSARASAIARGFKASIDFSAGPLRSYSDCRSRYSRTMSSDVVNPRVIASCSCSTVFSRTVKAAPLKRGPAYAAAATSVAVGLRFSGAEASVSRQFAICDRCKGVRPRRSGDATSFRAISVTRAISEPAAGTFASAGCSGTKPSRIRIDPLLASYNSLSPFATNTTSAFVSPGRSVKRNT